ncbi:MAG TPA: hypothetical protein VNN08_01905, partial [Thermoanaerobaculia bacterium]|nr:hypothetical protein [Thermoanaerobaculia bacterium]
ADHSDEVPAVAGADHSDWMVPFGNALTRDFAQHRRKIDQALGGIASVDVAPYIERAVKTRDGNSLIELVAERGMLRIAQRIRANDERRVHPETAAEIADALLRWHHITTGEDLSAAALAEAQSIADLVEEVDWSDLVPRLLAFAAHQITRSWPRDPWAVIDAGEVVREALGRILEGANKAAAAGSSLFLVVAAEIESGLATRLIDMRNPEAAFPRLIESVDWNVMVPRLLAYAHTRLARHGRAAKSYGSLAADYVQEAVRRLLDGSRRFEPALSAKVTLFVFLCSVIDSLVSHDAERTWRRGPHLPIGDDQPDEVSERLLPWDHDFTGEVFARDELEHFIAGLEPDLARYARLRAVREDATAEQLATELGISVSDIRNLDKRLRRRRSAWRR